MDTMHYHREGTKDINPSQAAPHAKPLEEKT